MINMCNLQIDTNFLKPFQLKYCNNCHKKVDYYSKKVGRDGIYTYCHECNWVLTITINDLCEIMRY